MPLLRFLRLAPADRRLLLLAAGWYVVVAIALRTLPFGRVRRLLDRAATLGRRPAPIDDAHARIVRAVRAVASRLPAGNCLADALVARLLLARAHCETTLCFGVAQERPAERPFDAHAWLEQRGRRLVGARAIVYHPFRHPTRGLPRLESAI